MAQAGVRRDAEGIWFDGQVGGGSGGGGGGGEAFIVDMRFDAANKTIQVKYSGSDEWVDKVAFAQFDD